MRISTARANEPMKLRIALAIGTVVVVTSAVFLPVIKVGDRVSTDPVNAADPRVEVQMTLRGLKEVLRQVRGDEWLSLYDYVVEHDPSPLVGIVYPTEASIATNGDETVILATTAPLDPSRGVITGYYFIEREGHWVLIDRRISIP